MKIENVTSSRNTLRSVFSCRNSRYGANQETSEVNIWNFISVIQSKIECDGGDPYKKCYCFPD